MIRNWIARPEQQEFALCQRYYEKTFAVDSGPAQNFGQAGEAFFTLTAATGAQQVGSYRYKVEKRVAPTVTFYNPSAANAQARDLNTASDCTATQDSGQSNASAFQLQVTAPGGAAVNNIIAIHFTFSAEL